MYGFKFETENNKTMQDITVITNKILIFYSVWLSLLKQSCLCKQIEEEDNIQFLLTLSERITTLLAFTELCFVSYYSNY